MRHRERSHPRGVDIHESRKRYGLACQRGLDIEAVERVETLLQFGRHFQDDPVRIELGEVLGNLALAIGIVECVIDRLRRDAEARGLIAIDSHADPRRVGQQIGRDIAKFLQRP